jgi:hypothetical protein
MKNVFSRIAQGLALTLFSWIGSADTAMAVRAAEDELVTAYLAIQEALVGDSATEAAASAKELAAAARRLAEEGKHSKDLESIAAAADRMKGTDLDALRSAFGPVSRAVAVYAEEAELGLGLFYCPMKKAYWLQKDDEVRNPYYGKSMLTCGEKAEEVER